MKIEKLETEIQNLREKITRIQAQLREKEQQKTELENTEIVGMVRELNVKPEELAAFIKAYQDRRVGDFSEEDGSGQEDESSIIADEDDTVFRTTVSDTDRGFGQFENSRY